MSNFIRVNSNNRHAARRLLTKYFSGAEARHWPNGRLGLELHNAINAGKLSAEEVKAALAAGELIDAPEADPTPQPVGPIETQDRDPQHDQQSPPDDDTAPAKQPQSPQPAKQTKPTDAPIVAKDMKDALKQMLEAMQAAADAEAEQPDAPKLLDEDSLRAIIRDEHSKIEHAPTAAAAGPSLITIKSEGATRTVSGRKHAQFETVLRVISTRVDGKRRHCWLTGPMGSGKSTLCRQVAEAAGLEYRSNGSIASKYELIGFVPANGDIKSQTLMTALRLSYEFGGVHGFDDVDGSDPKALTAFLGALDGQDSYMFPDGMVKRHPDFVCIASGNTWGTGATAEYVGRAKIDAAFLSRFAARVLIDYDEQLERDLVGEPGAKWAAYVQALRKVVTQLGLKIPVTPRHTIDGAALMAGGMNHQLVKDLTVYAGIDADTKKKLVKGVVEYVRQQRTDNPTIPAEALAIAE